MSRVDYDTLRERYRDTLESLDSYKRMHGEQGRTIIHQIERIDKLKEACRYALEVLEMVDTEDEAVGEAVAMCREAIGRVPHDEC